MNILKTITSSGHFDTHIIGYYSSFGVKRPVMTNHNFSLVWCDGHGWRYIIGKGGDYKTIDDFITDAKSDNFIGTFQDQ